MRFEVYYKNFFKQTTTTTTTIFLEKPENLEKIFSFFIKGIFKNCKIWYLNKKENFVKLTFSPEISPWFGGEDTPLISLPNALSDYRFLLSLSHPTWLEYNFFIPSFPTFIYLFKKVFIFLENGFPSTSPLHLPSFLLSPSVKIKMAATLKKKKIYSSWN